jgi:hypothetical protein
MKMAEIHVSITTDKSGNQITVHNPGVVPLPANAGQPVVATAKTAGNPNGNVEGQTVGVVFSNPA